MVCWSFGAAFVYRGASEVGLWPFVAAASLLGGSVQLASRRMYTGELRSALWLPWRLWAVPVLCFVAYGLAWPWALVSATPTQVFGVSLINYLWPVLTVMFSVWWVPGVRLAPRTVVALLLALAGLAAANMKNFQQLWSDAPLPATGIRWLPYALATIAAITWALYSAFLVRWRSWAKNYVTSPVGFLLVGVLSGGIALLTGHWPFRATASAAVWTVLYGVGPLAAGYLLWELALPKAAVQALSVVAACTPVLSTLLLCVFLRTAPGPELSLGALLVSGGVLLSMTE